MPNLLRRWMTKATKDLTPAVDGETLTAAELDAMPEPNAEDEAVPDAIAAALDVEVAESVAIVAEYDAQLAEEILALSHHPLDAAPVNSKLVLVKQEGKLLAVLATPDGVTVLPPDDPASALPDGARIRKAGPHRFIAEQLSPSEQRRELITETANDAIRQFLSHFHGPATQANSWRLPPEDGV